MHLHTEFNGLPGAEAAFYARLGLQLDLLTLADLSDWADEVILREEVPDSFFLGLYRLLRTGQPAEVAAYLGDALPPITLSVRPVLGWVQGQLATGTWTLGKTIKALYRLRTLVESDLEVGWIYGLAADYERAAEGPLGALPELHQETEAFLACYRDYTFARRAWWGELDAGLEQCLASLR